MSRDTSPPSSASSRVGHTRSATAPPARGFSAALARARRGAGLPLPGPALRATAAPVTALASRRRGADADLDRLRHRRTTFDDAAHTDATLRAPDALASPPATALQPDVRAAAAPPLAAATLAAAVERLALQIERRDAALGPTLDLRFGRALEVRLTRGPGGLEIALAADASVARAAEAELPELARLLSARGVRVARCLVIRHWDGPPAERACAGPLALTGR